MAAMLEVELEGAITLISRYVKCLVEQTKLPKSELKKEELVKLVDKLKQHISSLSRITNEAPPEQECVAATRTFMATVVRYIHNKHNCGTQDDAELTRVCQEFKTSFGSYVRYARSEIDKLNHANNSYKVNNMNGSPFKVHERRRSAPRMQSKVNQSPKPSSAVQPATPSSTSSTGLNKSPATSQSNNHSPQRQNRAHFTEELIQNDKLPKHNSDSINNHSSSSSTSSSSTTATNNESESHNAESTSTTSSSSQVFPMRRRPLSGKISNSHIQIGGSTNITSSPTQSPSPSPISTPSTSSSNLSVPHPQADIEVPKSPRPLTGTDQPRKVNPRLAPKDRRVSDTAIIQKYKVYRPSLIEPTSAPIANKSSYSKPTSDLSSNTNGNSGLSSSGTTSVKTGKAKPLPTTPKPKQPAVPSSNNEKKQQQQLSEKAEAELKAILDMLEDD
eukprot:TRINITY_DN2681_c3_g1_i1.p1 TRINITY_DN2681_c3_g1~~TRINITY_DN2681_c3_g1_i1.p1  ORF type:complete len:446 (+),score=129.01 TRINITY_DN2681_c3_g1_i1:92-1429(+)